MPLAPEWIFTRNQLTVLGDGFDAAAAGAGLPAGFIGSPAYIGRVSIFLASDESRYIIGRTILADGGQCCILPLTGDCRTRRTEQYGVGSFEGLTRR